MRHQLASIYGYIVTRPIRGEPRDRFPPRMPLHDGFQPGTDSTSPGQRLFSFGRELFQFTIPRVPPPFFSLFTILRTLFFFFFFFSFFFFFFFFFFFSNPSKRERFMKTRLLPWLHAIRRGQCFIVRGRYRDCNESVQSTKRDDRFSNRYGTMGEPSRFVYF